MNDTLYATAYFEYNGEICTTKTVEYSVRKYCENQLAKSSSTAEFKKVLVDILNYGAAAQLYSNYNIQPLVNARLTDAQLHLGTPVVFVVVDEDLTELSHELEYSIVTYAYNQCGKDTTSEKMKNLLYAMINYGDSVKAWVESVN